MIKRILRILLVGCILLSFYLFVKVTDIDESIRLVKQLGFDVIFIFISTFFAYLFGMLGWMYCIDSDVIPSYTRLYMYRHIGNIIALFNPSGPIAGEMYNADRLIHEGVEVQAAYKSVLLCRIIMILSQLLILLVVMGWFLVFLSNKLTGPISYAFYGCFMFFLIVICLLVYLLLKTGGDVAYTPSEKKWRRVLYRVKEMRLSLAQYIRERPKKAVLAFFSFTLQWMLSSLEVYFILRFLGCDVKIGDGLFVDTMIIVSKSAFWFIPGQIGAEELLNKFVLYLIGISSLHIWLSVTILRRIRLLFWSVVAGFFYIGLGQTKKNNVTENDEVKVSRVDTGQLIDKMLPVKKLPGFVIRFLERLFAINKINRLFASAPGTKNLEFVDACTKYLDITCHVVGEENLPYGEDNLIFVSNHPQGGIEAICIAHILGQKYGNRIKFFANEILNCFEPLKEMFVPVYRDRQKNRENMRVINEFYKTDNHLVVFPAGITSSKANGKMIEHEWSKNFVKAAIQYQRDVVPLYFQAQNSKLFYWIENFRKSIRSRINFDTVLFGHEFFKQRGKTLTLYIGKPVLWTTFDKSKTPKEWANMVKHIVLGLYVKGT